MSEPFAQYPYGQYGQNPAPEPPKRHRGRTMLGLTATAIVAAGSRATSTSQVWIACSLSRIRDMPLMSVSGSEAASP